MSEMWLELPAAATSDNELPADTVELPPGSLEHGSIAGLGVAWAQAADTAESGRVVALVERIAARPQGALVPVSLGSALKLNGTIQLRKPTGRELLRFRRADAIALYTGAFPVAAALVGAAVSTSLMGARLAIAMTCWIVTFLAASAGLWFKWRALRKNTR